MSAKERLLELLSQKAALDVQIDETKKECYSEALTNVRAFMPSMPASVRVDLEFLLEHPVLS